MHTSCPRTHDRFRRPPYPTRLARRYLYFYGQRERPFLDSHPRAIHIRFHSAPARPNRPSQPAPRGTSGRDSIRSPFLFCVLTYCPQVEAKLSSAQLWFGRCAEAGGAQASRPAALGSLRRHAAPRRHWSRLQIEPRTQPAMPARLSNDCDLRCVCPSVTDGVRVTVAFELYRDGVPDPMADALLQERHDLESPPLKTCASENLTETRIPRAPSVGARRQWLCPASLRSVAAPTRKTWASTQM